MSRQFYQDGMEVIFEDFNRMQARMQQEFYDRIVFEILQKKEDAFFGDSHKVNFASPTSITVLAGIGFQTDATVSAQEPQKRLLYLANNASANIVAPDTVNNRIDVVAVKWQLVEGEQQSRKFKAASTGVISNEDLNTSLEWQSEILIVEGTPAASPVAPAVPAGYIGIAEMLVTAVSGIANQSAITDTRDQMPLGSLATINSSAFERLTQSASLTVQDAFAEVDAFLKNGTLETNVFDDLVTDPSAPLVAGQVKLYNKGGLLFIRDQAGIVTPVGSGGGGGGAGANWQGSALEDEEFGQPIKRFAQAGGQTETLYVRVPDGYLSGRQISAFLGAYSPSSSNEFKLQIVSTLIRKGQDAISSTANQETNNSGDITNDQANEYRELELNLTTALGQVNGFSVSPGDLLKLELTRIAPTGTEDTADIRFIPSATEIKFG